jgi:hypothetical protein
MEMRRPVVFSTLVCALVLTAVSLPLPASSHAANTLVVVSDTSGVWTNHFGTRSGTAVLTYGNRGCGGVDADGFCTGGAWPIIAGAHWVWDRRNVTPAHAIQGVRPLNFVWSFALPEDATNIQGKLAITADNAYRVSLDGARVGKDGVLDRHGDDPSWTSVETFEIHPVPGSNTITIRAVNYRSTGSPFDNPAGILFRADITFDS